MTLYAWDATFKFSDDSDIGQVASSDGNSSNYRFFRIEPIKWIVLNYSYLPSQYGTGGNGTHTRLELLSNNVLVSGVAPTKLLWKDSNINKYLNNTFNKEAFPKTLLCQSTIYNNTNESDSNLDTTGSNNNYLADGSKPTTQSLYLLSRYEVFNTAGPYVGLNKIFRNDTDRIRLGTDYALAHYLYLNSSNLNTVWWLRSTTSQTAIQCVYSTGLLGENNYNLSYLGTRPAMQGGQECPL